MKLRATISIEFDAEDAIEARNMKRQIEAHVGDLAASYDDFKLVFTERRQRRRPRAPAPSVVYQPAATVSQ